MAQEKQIEILEKRLEELTKENEALKIELEEKNERLSLVAAENSSLKVQKVSSLAKAGKTVVEGYEFKYPKYIYDGNKITAEEIVKDEKLLNYFIKGGDAVKV